MNHTDYYEYHESKKSLQESHNPPTEKECPGCGEKAPIDDFMACEICGKEYCQNCMQRKVIGVDDYLDICDGCDTKRRDR